MRPLPRVLIIEASPPVATIETALATHCGCTSEAVTDSDKALDLLRANPYDVVLLGSPMPKANGGIILDTLRREFPQMASRTIVLTSDFDDRAFLDSAAQAAVFAVIAKPFDVVVLSRVLTACLHNGGRGSETIWFGFSRDSMPATAVM